MRGTKKPAKLMKFIFTQPTELNALKKFAHSRKPKKGVSEHFYAGRVSQTISGTL
jgi:hypothetical protein